MDLIKDVEDMMVAMVFVSVAVVEISSVLVGSLVDVEMVRGAVSMVVEMLDVLVLVLVVDVELDSVHSFKLSLK